MDESVPPLSVILERRNRMMAAEVLANASLPPSPLTLEEFWVDMGLPDGYQSRTMVIRPRPKAPLTDFLDSPRITSLRTSPKRPMLVYFHGGNFYLGSPLSLILPARLIAEELNITVLLPTCRLAPEHPWPRPFQDAMALVQTVASNPTYHYGADLEQGFLIGGISAGGSLAAVVAGLTTASPKQYPLYHPLTGVFISGAVLLTDQIVPSEYKQYWTSREDNRDTQDSSAATTEEAINILSCSDFGSPWFSPFNNAAETRGRHPPICLHTCSADPQRDDSVIYEKMLAAAGVSTRIHSFTGEEHKSSTIENLLSLNKNIGPTLQKEIVDGFQWLTLQTSV